MRHPRWTGPGRTALACAALLACGPAAHPGATPPGCPGIPSSGPGSTLWGVALDDDGMAAFGMGGPWADGDGSVFTIGVNGGKITAEKRDTSGARKWASEVEPACSPPQYWGFYGLGATDDGRFVVKVRSCPLGWYLPNATKVTLLDPSGRIASEFTTGWGYTLTVNRFGETYAISADVGSPIVMSPSGPVSGAPMLLRLIRPDGTDSWVDREGSLSSFLPGSFQPAPDGGALALTANGAAAFRIDRAGTLRWTADLPVTVTPYVFPYTAVLRDGSLAVAVETTGVVAYGGGEAGVAGERGRALVVVTSDGRPKTIIGLPATAPGDRWNLALAPLTDGGVAVLEYGASCERLWAFSSDLSLRWQRQLDASCRSTTGSAVSTPHGLVLLVAPEMDLVSLSQ